MGKSELRVPEKCGNMSEIVFKAYTFPFDFSSNAEFYVAAGVLTLMFTIGITVVYVFMHRLYTTNPMTAVVVSIFSFLQDPTIYKKVMFQNLIKCNDFFTSITDNDKVKVIFQNLIKSM